MVYNGGYKHTLRIENDRYANVCPALRYTYQLGAEETYYDNHPRKGNDRGLWIFVRLSKGVDSFVAIMNGFQTLPAGFNHNPQHLYFTHC